MSTVKWELACAASWEEAQKLASEGWEPVNVNQINGDEWIRFYFKRQVVKP